MRRWSARFCSSGVLAALAAQAPAPATPAVTGPLTDADVARLEGDLARAAVGTLLNCAHTVESNRMASKARHCYQLILDRYEPDNAVARQALGYHRDKGKGDWIAAPEGKEPKFVDAATPQLRQHTEEALAGMRKRLNALHRTLGLTLTDRDRAERGRFHLERALAYDVNDVEAHKGLGHRERGGLWASDEQFAFLDRMAAIRARAEQEQARDVPVKILGADAMPVELQRTGLEFVGARTAHVTLWLRGDQTQAAATAQWGERAIALLAFLAGQESAGTVTSHASDYRWLVMVRSKEEYDQVLDSNADRMDKAARATARRFGGTAMPVTGGNAYLLWHAVELDNDAIIGHYAEFCVGAYVNQGLGEGFVHAMTWMLVGTTHAHYGSVATTSAGGPNSPAFHADEWLAELRDQVRTGADIPLAQVLRERRTNFRTDVRRKSWWVMIWLVARYPDKWLPLVQALHPRSGKVALPADDEAAFQKVLGRTIADIDAEWRVWALGETPFAKASPYGGASR